MDMHLILDILSAINNYFEVKYHYASLSAMLSPLHSITDEDTLGYPALVYPERQLSANKNDCSIRVFLV